MRILRAALFLVTLAASVVAPGSSAAAPAPPGSLPALCASLGTLPNLGGLGALCKLLGLGPVPAGAGSSPPSGAPGGGSPTAAPPTTTGAPPPAGGAPPAKGPAPTPGPRTFRAAPPGVDPNGPSSDPSIGGDGRYVAFASVASNLGPVVGTRRISNIYRFDAANARVTLISSARNGANANDGSTTPSISADGQVVAFASNATNLVAGTPKHAISDIFVRDGSGPIRLVSVAFGGVQPDGNSSQPVISADGRYVAFTSAADDLVAGDDNAQPDVFVSDLTTGKIQRVSVTNDGRQAFGGSRKGLLRGSINPSISADGNLISFTSAARNLARGGVPQVFVRNRRNATTRRVSESSGGRRQNASVGLPFSQISDLSADGHYIVFDSDANNLAPGDRNGHTNVFRYSLVSGHTSLIVRGLRGRSGDNDSFFPATSADGRVTVFDSVADNLGSPLAPGPNVFAQDLATRRTLTPDVAVDGGPRGPELDAQLLQQAAVSADGQTVAFVSGADNLVAGDYNGADDVFVRTITPPVTTIVQAPPATTAVVRPMVEFRGNDPLATLGFCRLDGKPLACPADTPFQLPPQNPGSHVLTVSAGEPGTLFDPTGVAIHFTEEF